MSLDSREPSTDRDSGGSTEAEVFLQSRLLLLHKLFFYLHAGLLLVSTLLLGLLYSWEMVGRGLLQTNRLLHMSLPVVFGGLWALEKRVRLGGAILSAIDVVGTIGLAVVFSLMEASADTGRTGAIELVTAVMLALTCRAVIIPSSGTQTLALGSAAAAAAITVFTWQALHHPVELAIETQDRPRDHALTMVLWSALTVATTAVASRVIYGLRREVRAARRIGQYELLEKIGEGGMGVVYRARHGLLRRDTAIKLLPRANLPAERLQRFEREVQQTARLSHPNTVAIFDYGRTPDGVFYYAMEYLDGIDLELLVSHQGALPLGRAAHVLRQVLLSLTEAHEMGLVHRDIKPANVILTERGGEPDVAKVVDFGLVKDLRDAAAPGLTAAGAITGTPLYLPPEAITNPEAMGHAGDLYAAAAVGYFLVTGTHVFRGGSVLEICAQHLSKPPEPPSERLGRPLPESFERLMLSALAKRPEDRPTSARAFREALDACEGIPVWTYSEAHAWWERHRNELNSWRKTFPVSGSARTVAVELRNRHAF